MGPHQSRHYLAFFAVFAIIAVLFSWFHRLSIAGCGAYDYAPDTYMAYCNKKSFGDFEHGALGLGMAPVKSFVARAQILFFGHSHSFLAFSGSNTREYLGNRHIPFYILSLGGEYSAFPFTYLLPLLKNQKMAVIDVDPFFDPPNVMAKPGKLIRDNVVQATIDYSVKRTWQIIHRAACSGTNRTTWPCGDAFAFFRRIEDGTALIDFRRFYGDPLPVRPVTMGAPLRGSVEAHLPSAEAFIRRLHIPRRCIIFTDIPSSATNEKLAMALAAALGVRFIAPDVPGLATVDTSHLNEASILRWSTAFWQQATPIVEECTGSTVDPLPSSG